MKQQRRLRTGDGLTRLGDDIYGGDVVSRVVYVEANMKVTSRSGGLDKNQDIDGANSRTKGDK